MLLRIESLQGSEKADSGSQQMDDTPSEAPSSDPLVPSSVVLLLTLFQLDRYASFGHVALFGQIGME